MHFIDEYDKLVGSTMQFAPHVLHAQIVTCFNIDTVHSMNGICDKSLNELYENSVISTFSKC